jgi:sugar phosphate isomerase/epimerase
MTLSWLSDIVSRDVDRVLHYTLLWGFDAVELRMLGEARVPHVNEEKLIRRLAEAEVEVAAVNPGLFEGPSDKVSWMNDVALLPDTVRFCEHIGCRTILCSAFTASDDDRSLDEAVEALRRAGDVVARKQQQIAVLNEEDSLAPTGAALADLLDRVDHDAVGGAWSPADALRSGEDVSTGLASILPRIRYVRAAQVTGSNGAWVPSAFEAGSIDWPSHLRQLRTAGYDGVICMEMRAVPVKKQAIRDATWMIQEWRKAAKV